jgi:hypothetical protein
VTCTRCCIDTNDSPDDEHKIAQNMYRIEINIPKKELCVKLDIYKNYTEMHGQQKTKSVRVVGYTAVIPITILSTKLKYNLITFFSVMVLCCPASGYKCFWGTCHLHITFVTICDIT